MPRNKSRAPSLKIWILEIGEPLPIEQNARLLRYGQLSKFLAHKGHDVTWWASNFSHSQKKHLSVSDSIHNHFDAKLKIIAGPGYKSNISFARIRHSAHFAQRFKELAEESTLPDLIVCPIPTIEIANAAIEFAKRHKIPIVIDIRDIWPDEMVQIFPKILRPFARLLLTRAFARMKSVCLSADGITGVSQSFLDYALGFAKRPLDPTRDTVFPLGYAATNDSDTRVNESSRLWLESIGIEQNDFVICFFGTIGQFFDLSTVIRAARSLSRYPRIKFVLAGDGSSLERFRSEAADLENVIFTGWIQQPQIANILKVASVGLAPYKKDANMALPNKVFEYMSAGLPIISSISGELEPILESNRCGITYVADQEQQLSDAVLSLFENPETEKEMSANARVVFDANYSSEMLFEKFHEYLLKHCDSGTAT